MFAVLVPTRLPETSSTLTAGCTVHAVPSGPPPGWVEKTTWLAGPAVMEKSLLVALASGAEVALSE